MYKLVLLLASTVLSITKISGVYI